MPRLAAVLLAALLTLAAASARAEAVDMLLVLAIDGSGSTKDTDFTRQTAGHEAAFRDPTVVAALTSGPIGKVAVSAFVWSFEDQSVQCVDWTVIAGQAQADAFAERIARCPFIGGGTSVRYAIEIGRGMLNSAPHEAPRRVIDISANEKSHTIIQPWKLYAEREGIVINALVFEGAKDGLAEYYRDFVIVGPGSFVVTADGESYLDWLIWKLRTESAALAGGDG